MVSETTNSSPYLLDCRDVIKLYFNPETKIQVPALRGIELKIKEGDLIAIIGPSGSGKSTLINILGAIDQPSSGETWFRGELMQKWTYRRKEAFRRYNVGFLYQLPQMNLLYNLTALQNVLVPLRIGSRIGREHKLKRAKELLKAVGLSHRETHTPGKLSGGEAQRVGIATALANQPDLILADEPTGELDSITTFKIIDYFKELNKNLGTTFIIVTHDHRFANLTDTAFRIQDGRITGLHVQAAKTKLGVREEYIYVDAFGNLRLPKHVLEELRIGHRVKIEIRGKEAIIIPVTDDQVVESEFGEY